MYGFRVFQSCRGEVSCQQGGEVIRRGGGEEVAGVADRGDEGEGGGGCKVSGSD
jgi:hypothetical protein